MLIWKLLAAIKAGHYIMCVQRVMATEEGDENEEDEEAAVPETSQPATQ